MSLPNYLSNIKSSGIYRFVWDKSEIPGAQADTLRLVVGYSDKGPFNTPVYVKDAAEFKSIYGNISKKLERYGSWFHRMAIQALKKGPILAFNLKPFESETVEGISFNPQEDLEAIDQKVSEIYNTNRFWTLEPEILEEIENDRDMPKYIRIIATDSDEISNTVFIRGYQPKGYDVTFKEWFSSVLNGESLPTYLEGHENDLLSQYFAEIYVFRGEFTPAIATNDKLNKFFKVDGTKVSLQPYLLNAFGEKIDTLEALAANSASNFLKSYHGIVLPEFLSATNTVISLDNLFNQDNYLHKMMMRFNQAALYEGKVDGRGIDITDLDTTGWLVKEGSKMMSIESVKPLISEATYENDEWIYTDVDGVNVNMYKFNELTMEAQGDNTALINPEIGSAGIRIGDKFRFKVGEENKIATLTKVDTVMRESYTAEAAKSIKATSTDTIVPFGEFHITSADENTSSVNYKFTLEMAQNNYQGHPSTVYDTAKFLVSLHDQGINKITYKVKDVDTVFEWNDLIDSDSKFSCAKLEGYDEYMNKNDQGSRVISTGRTSFVHVLMKDAGTAVQGGQTSLTTTLKGEGDVKPQTITYIAELTDSVNQGTVESDNKEYLKSFAYTFDMNVVDLVKETSLTKCVSSVAYTSANLAPTYVKGYTYLSGKPKSTKQADKLAWQHHILDVLGNKNIRTALTSRVDVDYRYIVDTFESFVESECKARIISIAKEKDNAFALVNFPAMTSFSRCDYTSFTDQNGLFDTKYIPMGGNPRKTNERVFSLASEENGASYVSYNTCLSIRDVNTNIKYTCPAAALVSNLYMDKYTKYFPYTIVAGPNRAVISENGLIGPDFNFSREDLDNLEPFGVNCMVMVPGKGTFINSNQTAKQNPVTTLSKINVRELCIFLQDEIENLLQQYQWDFNTPNLRSTIKDRADVILETAKNNGGVYKYLNVCDESNNTDDVINNEMFVLSTSIEPGIGAGKMVQELTLYRKGGMSSMIKD